ncbi:RNA polymerase-binding protein DksA [Gammaproteobacteria bacterium]|nr:RNA polymerase-binding protein DksA [Gammaproteobacteria bacterium]
MGIDCYEAGDGEEYMGPQQVAHFKQVLTHWYQSLLQEVDGVVVSLQRESSHFDQIDRASHEENQRMELRSSDRRRRLQVKVVKALLRIKQGEYGFCKSCGADIGTQRLEARPTADECIKCKTISEIYEERRG